MKYMLLIYSDPSLTPSGPELEAEMSRWFAYTDELGKSGALVAGDALHPPETATSVRVRDGERITTDGPFAETKEILGGYYLIDVADLDTALDWAAKMPNMGRGTVEVRPVVNFDEMPAAEAGAEARA